MLKVQYENRTEVINHLISRKNYKSYLEIGANRRWNFDSINCDHKICVEPFDHGFKYDYQMNSNDFFKINQETFDVIFLDGSHLAEQLYMDFHNALKVLNHKGSIVIDDVSPTNEFLAGESYNEKNPSYPYWDGTVWKTIYRLRCERDDLIFKTFYEKPCFVMDIKLITGICVIKKGKGVLLKHENKFYNYNIFAKNKHKILNTY
jgi:hypothetical protein